MNQHGKAGRVIDFPRRGEDIEVVERVAALRRLVASRRARAAARDADRRRA